MRYSFPLMGQFKSFMFKHEREGNYTVKITVDKQNLSRKTFSGVNIPLFYTVRSNSDDDITKQDNVDLIIDGDLEEPIVVSLNAAAANGRDAAIPVPFNGICTNVTGKDIEVLLYSNSNFGSIEGTIDVVDGVSYDDTVQIPYTAPLNSNDKNTCIIDIPDFSKEYKVVPFFTSNLIAWPTTTQVGVADPAAVPSGSISNDIISEDWQPISLYAVGLSIVYETGDAINNQTGEVYFKVRR